MEAISQSCWHALIKATPPAPDTSPGSAEILLTYRGDKNHSSRRKANTDLLINYLQGGPAKISEVDQEGGERVAGRWEEVVGAQLTLQRVRLTPSDEGLWACI